jgi:hypothetical protein
LADICLVLLQILRHVLHCRYVRVFVRYPTRTMQLSTVIRLEIS